MAKYEQKQKAGIPDWMATYGDMVTLLLCFFIMLFASSTIDSAKYENLVMAFNPSIFEATGGEHIVGDANGSQNQEMTEYLSKELVYQSELQNLEKDVSNFVSKEGLEEDIEVIRDEDKITLRFDSSLIFESGKAVIKEKVKPYIKTISKSFPEDFQIQVEGHTDNIPINNEEYASNWELSSFRAINVLKYLIEYCNIDSKKLSVAGYGEYRPIASNSTKEGQSQNRRVDIILLKNEAAINKK